MIAAEDIWATYPNSDSKPLATIIVIVIFTIIIVNLVVSSQFM